jgi:hypothetical protein
MQVREMKPSLDIKMLCQQWIHSKEEDGVNSAVFRTMNFTFPPSRGRTGLEFCENGKLKRIGLGATDLSTVTSGTWKFEASEAGQIEVVIDDVIDFKMPTPKTSVPNS